MKKRYLVIGLLTAIQGFGQHQASPYAPQQLKKTDVQLLFSYYSQDNDHSAVTGGKGTEDLRIYGTSIAVAHRKDSVQTFRVAGGVDLISSASTDNIDFVMSSASKTDFRAFGTFGYARQIRKSRYTVEASAAFSLESDYLSLGPGIQIAYADDEKGHEWFFNVQAFFDDLRWIHDGRHQGLIYPVELRDQEWFDIHRRNSFNFSLGILRVINRRMNLTFYPGIAYQKGLLSTPFHRVYFSDESLRVEKLRESRVKTPIALQWNTFIGSRLISRFYYRYYWDSFGIRAHTVNVELPVRISRVTTVVPFMRFYTQTAADDFRPYGQHEIGQQFYTSDYDLSAFTSIKPGLGVRFSPYSKNGNVTFEAVEFRYGIYHRSDGLTAHMISLMTNWSHEKSNKK